jgi:hypothetical protein
VPARAGVLSLVAALLSAGLGACGGGSSQSAQKLVQETFAPPKPARSGRIALSFVLSTPAAAPSRSPGRLTLRLSGPFQSTAPSRLPRFALQLDLRSQGLTGGSGSGELHAGLTSTGERLYIALAGSQFRAPQATLRALESGYAKARSSSSGSGSGSLASLGLDPTRWLVHPRIVGSAPLAGVETTHIAAAVNMKGFLEDTSRLTALAGSLGLGAGSQGSRVLPPQLASVLTRSARSARMNIYTGKSDHLLRRLALVIIATPAKQQRAAIGGVRRVTLRLVVQLTALNQPQSIAAPSNPQPAAKLPGALQRLGLTAGGTGG